ncbi:putative acyl-activating enzyme 19 isoform X3 [Magnolia sinica]|uniref:putative acyl-activating enzyme 19 isoform X3 n=1 Tax=Magnolia sinica TaxID=86752 RepID=UPI00265A8776|nr:putative acyl-activating enzyme 19 isoform X3 [Magnolia sinica]
MSDRKGERERGEIPCCISHAFFKEASRNPRRIAIVHASGGARVFRESHAKADYLDFDAEELLNRYRESSSPPLYSGDEFFTYADISSAVNSLSFRISRVLDGGDDPHLIRPEGLFHGKKTASDRNLESSTMVDSDSAASNKATPQIVGIFIAPSAEYIVSILSVLRCGAAFLPLDPFWPKDRILSIISSSKIHIIIKCTSFSDSHQLRNDDWLVNQGRSSVLSVSMKGNLKGSFGHPDLVWPCESRNPRRFCYLMYTSGSTGKPKGVCGTEKGLLNRLLWMQALFPLHEVDILLFKTSISFIDHLQEFLTAILTCTPLIIPPFHELKENPFCLLDFLKAYYVSRVTVVPSLMRAILPAMQSPNGRKIQETLQVLVFSGEVLTISLWNVLHKLLPKAAILNLYGSTEVSGDCTYFDCKNLPMILETEVLTSVPIGVPISNCDIVLVGESDTPDEGEIYVGGSCLSIGYLSDPTNMSMDYVRLFQDSEHSHDLIMSNESQLYFRTGDFARQLQSGDFVFLGRKDRMVKVNGQRIALEEIEDVLREHPDVDAAAVTFHKGQGDFAYFGVYLVLKRKDEQFHHVDVKHASKEFSLSIKSWLVRKLPPTMIPSHYFCVESLPMSSSGKIDYSSLTRTTFASKRIRDETDSNQCDDDTLQVIKEVFCDMLMVEEVTDHDDFFAMGGNSVVAAQVAHKLGIDMRSLYIHPTPSLLLKFLLDSESSYKNMSDIGSDLGIRLKAHKGMLHSFDAMNNDVYSNQLLGRPTEAAVGEQVLNFAKQLDKDQLIKLSTGKNYSPISFKSSETNSKVCKTSNSKGWIASFCLPMAVSFSRCNKVMHELELERNNVHQSCLSVEISRNGKGFMQELWKVPLNSCVDASPLVVLKDGEVCLLIGSHSHMFLCVNALSGLVRWKVKLEGRIECSAAITGDFSQVVVGCYQGNIYFLDFKTGEVSWSFQTGGEVKSQPVVDKYRHMIWCGSHDHNLYALDYRKHCCVYKVSCGGSIYGSPIIDKVHNVLYVASTSGRVTAISIEQACPFGTLWLYESGAPIFGSLSINPQNGDVICCLVDGHVMALNSSGSIIWKAITGGPIFAGACISSVLPSQEGGGLLWEYEVGDPITSSAYIDENTQLISDPSHPSDRLACICSSSGSIHVLRIDPNAVKKRDQQVEAAAGPIVQKFTNMDLPGDIFSSPVMIGSRIFVGCRDDHVYCIDVVCQPHQG